MRRGGEWRRTSSRRACLSRTGAKSKRVDVAGRTFGRGDGEVVKVEAVLVTAEPPMLREAEPEQQVQAEPEDVREGDTFEIKLQRLGTRQQILGIEVNHGDKVCLVVERISTNPDSLVQTWNTANRSRQVRIGDKIIRVNGASGSAMEMINECKNLSKALEMTLRRGCETASFPP